MTEQVVAVKEETPVFAYWHDVIEVEFIKKWVEKVRVGTDEAGIVVEVKVAVTS